MPPPTGLVLAMLGCLASAAQAQPQTAERRASAMKISGSYRTRVESWSWFRGEGDSAYTFSGNIFRVAAGRNGKAVDWQVEFAAPFLLNLPERALAPAPQLQLGLGASYFAANRIAANAAMFFPKQGFIRWKGRLGGASQSLRLGRFEFNDASEFTPQHADLAFLRRDRMMQRLIGAFAWTHVGRSFDGVHYAVNRPGVNYTLVAVVPTRGVFQVDGWGNLHIGFGYLAANGQVNRKAAALDWRLFGIYYHDWRKVLKTDSRPVSVRQQDLGNIGITSFGGHLLASVHSPGGPVDLVFWQVVQTGRWGRLDHRGWSTLAEAGWQPKALPRLKPWLRGGFYLSSGDRDPNDRKHGSFFQLLPTPRPFARFPFYDMVNNDDFQGALMLRPHKSVTVRGEAHALRLASRTDLWYLGGGAFQPWTFGYLGRNTSGERALANLYDASLDWNPRPAWTLTGYFGYADGKGALRRIYPAGPRARFGYLELTYRF